MSEKEEENVDVETPEVKEDKPSDGGDHVKVPTQLTQEQKGYCGMMISAIIQLIAITSPDKKLNYVYVYGITLGSVTLILSLIGLAVGAIERIDHKAKLFFAYFVFCWNFIGVSLFFLKMFLALISLERMFNLFLLFVQQASFMTFGSNAPFNSTGNGYFGSWGMALFSILVIDVSFDKIKKSATATGMGAQFGLFVSSLIVLIAACSILVDGRIVTGDQPYNIAIFAVTLSSISVIAMAGIIFCGVRGQNEESKPNPIFFLVWVVLCICWIFEAFYATFRGPFTETGNGYFGSWAAAFSALFATIAGVKRLIKKD